MNIQRLAFTCLIAVLLHAASFAGKKSATPELKTASVNMIVIRNASGKPVKNAEVVIHLIDDRGEVFTLGIDPFSGRVSIEQGDIRPGRGVRTHW